MKFTIDVLGVFLKVVIKVSFVINTWEWERSCPTVPAAVRRSRRSRPRRAALDQRSLESRYVNDSVYGELLLY